MARNIKELLELIRIVDGSSIFYHTHRCFREHYFECAGYSSDFAQWIADSLHEPELGERLAAIDIHKLSDVEALRCAVINGIEDVIAHHTHARNVPKGVEFYFLKPVNIVLPTNQRAKTLDEFVESLGKVSVNSLYFHIFEARLRLGKDTNDFSKWIAKSLGKADLAREIEELDPYSRTLEESREEIMKTISEDGRRKT